MTMGGVALGAALVGLITPRAPSNDILNQLIKDKPEFYKFVDIDLSTARTDQVYDEPGTFIWVDNQFARGEVTLRLNELKFGKFDLRRQKYVQGPFYRFFITNVAGQGLIRLFVSRGYQAASEPIEAINRAELAARLGSIVTFDRRGDVIFMDAFEDFSLHWRTLTDAISGVTPGTGAAVDLLPTWALKGDESVRLTTGSSDAKWTGISRFISSQPVSKVGTEFAFMLEDHDGTVTHDKLYMSFYFYKRTSATTTTHYDPGILFDFANAEVKYRNSSNNWVKIGDLGFTCATACRLSRENSLFHICKLVADISTGKYVRAMLDDQYWDLSAYNLYSVTGSSIHPHNWIYIGAESSLGNAVVYIDNVIVTQNEP